MLIGSISLFIGLCHIAIEVSKYIQVNVCSGSPSATNRKSFSTVVSTLQINVIRSLRHILVDKAIKFGLLCKCIVSNKMGGILPAAICIRKYICDVMWYYDVVMKKTYPSASANSATVVLTTKLLQLVLFSLLHGAVYLQYTIPSFSVMLS